MVQSFQPGPAGIGRQGSGMMLLLQACDALAANPLVAHPPVDQSASAVKYAPLVSHTFDHFSPIFPLFPLLTHSKP